MNIACNVLPLSLRRKVWSLKLYKKMISPNTGLWENLTNNNDCEFPEWAIVGEKMGCLLKIGLLEDRTLKVMCQKLMSIYKSEYMTKQPLNIECWLTKKLLEPANKKKIDKIKVKSREEETLLNCTLLGTLNVLGTTKAKKNKQNDPICKAVKCDKRDSRIHHLFECKGSARKRKRIFKQKKINDMTQIINIMTTEKGRKKIKKFLNEDDRQ